MISEPIKGLEPSPDYPRLEATKEAVQNWLEKIDSDIQEAKTKDNHECERTLGKLQYMYKSIKIFICEKEKEAVRLRKLVQLEEKKKDYQEQLLNTLELLNADAFKRVLEYARTLSKAPEFQYKANSNGGGQIQQKIIPVESCELLDFHIVRLNCNARKSKNFLMMWKQSVVSCYTNKRHGQMSSNIS